MQVPEELKALEGQEVTHFPPEASWLFEQVKQNVEEPAQLLHDVSQAAAPICQCAA